MKNGIQSHQNLYFWRCANVFTFYLQNTLNSQRRLALVKTAETMGILDTFSDGAKQADIDEILGFLASIDKVSNESSKLNLS